MTKRSEHIRDWHERRIEAARNHDRPLRKAGEESKPKGKSSERTKKPGEVGLANEARPGLGTRAKTKRGKITKRAATPHDAEPLGRDAPLPPAKPRPAPREQASDSMAREQERDTGVSGHMSGD